MNLDNFLSDLMAPVAEGSSSSIEESTAPAEKSRKRALSNPGVPEGGTKKARTVPSGAKKRAKTQATETPESFLANPRTAERGVQRFTVDTGFPEGTPEDMQVEAAMPRPRLTSVMPPRNQQHAQTLQGPRASLSTLEFLNESSLIGSDVPAPEILMQLCSGMTRSMNDMYRLRQHFGLPTGLENASASIRAASGMMGTDTDQEREMAFARREGRLPALAGLPAETVARTRHTMLGGGQLAIRHRATGPAPSEEERMAAFFASDALEQVGPEGGHRPEAFAMFRQLRRDYGDRFRARDEFLATAGTRMPRTDPVPLGENFFLDARFPPRGPEHGERPCAKGSQCRFMTYAVDTHQPTNGYIGKELLLPDELAVYARTGELPATPHLCIECELYEYTRNVYLVSSTLTPPEHPVNRFCLDIPAGKQPRPGSMLPPIVNKLFSGISGHVPRYDRATRYYKEVELGADHPLVAQYGRTLRILRDTATENFC